MTTVVVAPLADYAAGTFTVNEFSVADSVSRFVVTIQRCTGATPTIWPSSSVGFTASFDFFDGSQWIPNVFFLSDSGGIRTSHAADVPASYAIWPFPAGAGRKLRGAVIVTGGTLRSSVSVDVT